jgi:formamidopyrimidine-DNA glycosylase
MPEMPEVETVVRSLRRYLPGRRIRAVTIHDNKLNKLDAKKIASRKIREVFRSGKEIVIDLSVKNEALWLCVHLRMTGRLSWLAGDLPHDQKHLRAHFALDRGHLYFVDSRRFGVIRLATEPEEIAPPGVEILSLEFTPKKIAELLDGSRAPIKVWLLRQDRIVGFGNIYASEVCHLAGIDPRRPAGSLKPLEIKRLHAATLKIFNAAIDCGGTTIDDFMDCDGNCGDYVDQLQAYEREGEKCLKKGCRGAIQRIVQAGRSTYYCSKCQR